jgi:hypothetical protein
MSHAALVPASRAWNRAVPTAWLLVLLLPWLLAATWALHLLAAPQIDRRAAETLLEMSNLRKQVSPGRYWWPPDNTNTDGDLGSGRGSSH